MSNEKSADEIFPPRDIPIGQWYRSSRQVEEPMPLRLWMAHQYACTEMENHGFDHDPPTLARIVLSYADAIIAAEKATRKDSPCSTSTAKPE